MKTDLFFVHLYNDYSGSPRVFRDAIDIQSEYSDQKYLLTSQHQGFLSGVDCKAVCLPYFRFNNKLLVLINYLLTQLLTFIYLSIMLITSRILGRKTRVIVNTLLPFGGNIAAKLFSHELYCYIHETSINPPLLRAFLRKIVSLCGTKIIYVSSYLKNEVGFFDDARECVIHNAIRRDFNVLSVVSEPKVKFSYRCVLFVGSLKDFKGVYNLIALASKMPTVNFNAALNSSKKEYKEFIKKNNIPENLTLYLRPDNIERLYEESSIVVNLSIPEQWVETFGLTIVEGFAKGCPAIVPPEGGPIEIINSNCGIAIHSNDINKLIETIKLFLDDYIYWKQLSDGAIERAKDFNYGIYKQKMNNIFSIEKELKDIT